VNLQKQEGGSMRQSYPLKKTDPLAIKLAYLFCEIAVALWFGASLCVLMTGGI
jgi:hypothetical protein